MNFVYEFESLIIIGNLLSNIINNVLDYYILSVLLGLSSLIFVFLSGLGKYAAELKRGIVFGTGVGIGKLGVEGIKDKIKGNSGQATQTGSNTNTGENTLGSSTNTGDDILGSNTNNGESSSSTTNTG